MPVLHRLHWLPVRRPVDVKISTLVYLSLAGTAPVYLADECTLVTAAGRHPWQSADSWTCVIKRSRNQFGDHSFATAGPMLWNSLPEQLRQLDITFGQFKRSLKTFTFGSPGRCALCLNVKGANKKSSCLLTYLLTWVGLTYLQRSHVTAVFHVMKLKSLPL